MDKRGEGEQFNWIFVIISGAIILGFFVMFTFKYVELQEKRQDVDTVRFFGGKVLSAASKLQVGGGAEIDSNENEGLRFGYNVNLGYDCNGNSSTILINQGETAWYKLKDEVVFMNKEINVNSLDLWILPWNYPFYITNFIYIADPKSNIYLVSDYNSKDFVDSLEISSIFNVNRTNAIATSDIKSNTKVVYFTNQKPTDLEIKGLKKNITNVDFVYINLGRKEVSYFDKSWSNPVKFYFNDDEKGLLYGAILSNNAKSFGCNVNRSISRLGAVAKVYAKRAEILGQIDRRSDCHYGEIANSLEQYSKGNVSLIETINNQNVAGAGCIWAY